MSINQSDEYWWRYLFAFALFLQICVSFLFCYYYCCCCCYLFYFYIFFCFGNHILSLICNVVFSLLHFLVSINNQNEQSTNTLALLKYFKNTCDSNMKWVNENERSERWNKNCVWNAIFIRMTLLISVFFFFAYSFVCPFLCVNLFCVSSFSFGLFNVSFFICYFIHVTDCISQQLCLSLSFIPSSNCVIPLAN